MPNLLTSPQNVETPNSHPVFRGHLAFHTRILRMRSAVSSEWLLVQPLELNSGDNVIRSEIAND